MDTKNFRYYNYAQDTDIIYIEIKRAGIFCNQSIGSYNRGTNRLYLHDVAIVRNRINGLSEHFGVNMQDYVFSRSCFGFNSWVIALSFKPTIKRNSMQYYKMIGE